MFSVPRLLHVSSTPSRIVRSMSLLKSQGYINGKWVPASTGETFAVCNPVNNSIITEVPDMSVEDTTQAIDAAKKAFQRFRTTTAKERSDLLRCWYNLMLQSSEELAEILTKENGKSLAESRAEIKYGNSFVEWFSEESRRINGEVLQAPVRNRKLLILKQPIGVAALITPWNFPHAMITRKAGAAIAAGCTCIIKPSEDTPLTALALGKLAEDAGFPPGVINIVTTSPKNSAVVGKLLCESTDVRALSFTGSTAVGKILYNQCASTVKRIGLELGGNAPFIIFEKANMDLAVAGAMASKFRNTGQTCVSANRFYVHDKRFDEFLQKFKEKISGEIKMGDGSLEGITHGPLIKSSQVETIECLVNDALEKGAKLHCGGKRLDNLGPLFYAPTVLTDVDESMEIYGKEIFGPVAVIHRFKSEEDVVKMANSVPVGLAGYFYSEDLSQIFRVTEKLEVGMIGVNEGIISCAEAAFGGVKESGIGREGSTHGIEDFLDIKYLCIGNVQH
ncbi:succinate-semialdehyde dehydrogenase, mitochondrial [Fopius arisanus]|uniref:Succinate-semialdehyde dehydrogenase, mitochondrial n=1 Tax=Fopius arisanus TaxID=64838 RepID=A0A9R1U246_9HYME|nr:PREDICTED: succinate-semialdehyde dehydrogenase, mitochondrial [Fopius arisanus]XP_011304383.1 PREDICTED: succinate-semialdehyde dehydrogenase, mitochondrial [Fopius arisanus]XP_011304384.1 PREDICTED: succinate-semialdehyde dehydrogenase, mitochondrial [Fopius arisanus]